MSRKKPWTLQWWMVPRKDEHEQWWWGYQKVRMVVLPEEDKLKFIEKMTSRQNVQKQ